MVSRSYTGHGHRRAFEGLSDHPTESLCQRLEGMLDFADIPITILAGGLGTRLRSVLPTRPKVLALVQGRPFLIYLLDQLAAVGAKEIVFCVGYMADTVEETLGDQYQAIRLTYSREKEPLGTGGALRQALSFFSSDPVLVMNGDSFMDADLAGYLHWFLQKGLEASLALAQVFDTSRFGQVTVDEDERIMRFEEKGSHQGPGWINAGIYLLRKEILQLIPEGMNYSLEGGLFPNLLPERLYGYRSEGKFIDIGTPESYSQAENFFATRPASSSLPEVDRDQGD